MSNPEHLTGVKVLGICDAACEEILTPEALGFNVVDLERRFGAKRRELLAARSVRQQKNLTPVNDLRFFATHRGNQKR